MSLRKADRIQRGPASAVVSPENGLSLAAQPNRWIPSKHPNNPVVAGTVAKRDDQFYPPAPFIGPDGTYYLIGKSNPDLVGFSSPDGVTWTEQGVVLESGSGDDWDKDKLEYTVVRYDPVTELYHLYYIGFPDEGIGHATSSNPMGPYTKDVGNPLYTVSDFNSDFGRTSLGLQIGDVIKVGDEFVFYCVSRESSSRYQMFVATGSDWDDINGRNLMFHGADTPLGSNDLLLQGPNVIRHGSTFVMVYTAGRNSPVLGERQLYSAVGGPYHFVPVDGLVMPVGSSGAWDDRRVYISQWLKRQDGEYLTPHLVNDKYRMYYSGHSIDGNVNLGLTGLVEFDEIPVLSGMALNAVLSVLQSPYFQNRVEALGGMLVQAPNTITRPLEVRKFPGSVQSVAWFTDENGNRVAEIGSTGNIHSNTGFLMVQGTVVVRTQQAAVANATEDLGSVTTQLNALLARLRTHGLIAT